IRNLQRRLTLNPVIIAYFGRLLGPKRDLNKLISHKTFGTDRGHGVLLDYVAGPAREIHQDAHLVVRPYRQLNLPNGSFMNSSDANFGSPVQASNILELGFKAIRRVEQELLLPDPEHSSGKDQQRYDDEDS